MPSKLPQTAGRRPASPVVLLLFNLLSCALWLNGACESKTLETQDLTIQREGGEPVILRTEIARSAEEKKQGLMFRKSLADGHGMLFVFDRDQIMSFYMKNTYVPLSIAFISSDGTITEIRNMRPLDETTIQSSWSVRYALEVPQGWFDRAEVKAGDRLLLSGF
ncbi:MAG: DUF192 domain-containing protein [Treponema sp.]|jgi:uncharacterized membrane protein (UPF0127 family)|nr:DUF192 domain-containing protein [Treponema sp.]